MVDYIIINSFLTWREKISIRKFIIARESYSKYCTSKK